MHRLILTKQQKPNNDPEISLRKRLIPTSLVLIGFATLAIGFFSLELKPNRVSNSLPPRLAGIDIASSVTGQEAILEIVKMHNNNFPIVSGDIGSYGSNRELTIWAADAYLVANAQEMMQAMEESISTGNSPFTPTGDRMIDDRAIYELSGMNQRHFYFLSGSKVIWLAANPQFAEVAIDQLLEYFP